MAYAGSTPNLECYTSRHQLSETRKWLDEMMETKIFNNSDDFDRHLHGFCNSFASTIDYVHSDFVYHKVKKKNKHGNLVSIDWKKFSRNENDRKEITENHPEKQALKKFRGEYKNKKDILLRDPLVNYFYNKRQESTHIRWHSPVRVGDNLPHCDIHFFGLLLPFPYRVQSRSKGCCCRRKTR